MDGYESKVCLSCLYKLIIIITHQVFSASGLELVTRTRVEHLPKEEREKRKGKDLSVCLCIMLTSVVCRLLCVFERGRDIIVFLYHSMTNQYYNYIV